MKRNLALMLVMALTATTLAWAGDTAGPEAACPPECPPCATACPMPCQPCE
jgi:hypothetical protein